MIVTKADAQRILANAYGCAKGGVDENGDSIDLFTLGALITTSLLSTAGEHYVGGGTVQEIAAIESELADGITAGATEYAETFGVSVMGDRRLSYAGELLN